MRVARQSLSRPLALATLKLKVTSESTLCDPHVAKNVPVSFPEYFAPERFRTALSDFSVMSDHVTLQAPVPHLGSKCHPAVKPLVTLVNPLEEVKVNLTLKSPSTRASDTGGLGALTTTVT